MNHDEYTSLVDRGDYPSDSVVPLGEPFVDERGSIQNLLLKPCNSVAVITSRKGTVRANHRHRTDWHYIYVLSGSALYFERAAGDTEVPAPLKLEADDMVFTAPNREHAMLFTSDCTILTFARNVRTHENHENDVVRVPFLSAEQAAHFLGQTP